MVSSPEFYENLQNKIKKTFKKAGTGVVYSALLLFYALKDPSVPKGAKATIVGALGYFIVPLDLIPDIAPVVGYGDDLAALIAALGAVAMYISPETKEMAKDKCKEWFGDLAEEDFKEIDDKL